MAKDGELSVVTMDGGPNLLYFVLCATISCDTGWRVQFFALSIFDLFRSKRPEKQPKNHVGHEKVPFSMLAQIFSSI